MDVKAKQRSSNLELLRIVAMLMVLGTHLLTAVIRDEVVANPAERYWVKFLTQWMCYLTWTCVNLFVLISGWFAVRPTCRKVASYVFNVLFFAVGILVVALIMGKVELTEETVLSAFVWVKYYWFLGAYLVLMIFAPALNVYCETCSRRQLEIVLLSFFGVQFLYDCTYPLHSFSMFGEGYSPISFFGLYLLGRYMRLYNPGFTRMSKWMDLGLALGIITVFTAICVPLTGAVRMHWIVATCLYTSPNVLLTTIFIFLFFSKLRIQSKIVNWLAASALAVYLLHTHFCVIGEYFKPLGKRLWFETSGMQFVLGVMLFLVFWFAAAVILDQLRKCLWQANFSKRPKKVRQRH